MLASLIDSSLPSPHY